MQTGRRNFLKLLLGAVAVKALPIPPAPFPMGGWANNGTPANWEAKSAAQILADFNTALTTTWANYKPIPDVLVMPLSSLVFLETKLEKLDSASWHQPLRLDTWKTDRDGDRTIESKA
jgi:hypothetical protein